MAITVDIRDDGTPVRWEADGRGAVPVADPDYRPALVAAARDDRTRYLDWLRDELAADPKVAAIDDDRAFTQLGADDRSPVLRIAVERVDEVRQVAREIRQREHRDHAPGAVRLFDVDLDPGFRYCLDTRTDPLPDRELRTLSLSLPTAALAADDPTGLTVDGEPAGDDAAAVRRRVRDALAERDPDVLVLSSADLVPLLADLGLDLGRRSGYRRLAGETTVTSYGKTLHSPARFAVPGRAVVDRSASFLLRHSAMPGLLYFVEQTGKPLAEVAKDSIGGVLTALEIRRARERDVVAPWQKRQTERWKSLETLSNADRGGFTFQPEAGVVEGVHQLDFASLFPNIMRERNVSPETVDCDCHDNDAVPELDYSICEEPGFLGDVLGGLLDDRQRWKRQLRAGEGDTDTLAAKVEAVKWVLVSCFGYQGYRHAKFGRIEAHEAINAYAREILLTAKERLEAAGWQVVHGIVDSLWLRADPDREQTPVRTVAAEVTDAVGIELEYEGRFDWIAFCPRKRASGSALMRYFGRWADGGDDPYKFRGIEARQRSTSAFTAAVQRDLVAAFDRERDPEAVCARLARHLARLRRGAVSADRLTVTQRVSKRADEYRGATRAKAALERAASLGVERHPGQCVEYVVVDDEAAGRERVRLAFEDGDAYDPAFYADRLVRACESVLGPLGWDEGDVRRALADTRDATLSSFGD
ncbi:type B DNA-directed DNA polymerase [Halosimplex halobium]|uniref:type B DNA-directed DNA polymerase n=1 Tax=Halosimplex halobium TaxID=3396618 RepID=UPI003F556451